MTSCKYVSEMESESELSYIQSRESNGSRSLVRMVSMFYKQNEPPSFFVLCLNNKSKKH